MAGIHTNQHLVMLEQQVLLQLLSQHVCELVFGINSKNFDLSLLHIFAKVLTANIYVFGTWPHFRESVKFQSSGAIPKAMTTDINCITINVNIELFP